MWLNLQRDILALFSEAAHRGRGHDSQVLSQDTWRLQLRPGRPMQRIKPAPALRLSQSRLAVLRELAGDARYARAARRLALSSGHAKQIRIALSQKGLVSLEKVTARVYLAHLTPKARLLLADQSC